MTWNEYQRRVNGYNLRQWHAWDRTRRIASESYNTMREKPIHYMDYISLPTDEEVKRTQKAAELAANLAFLERMKAKGRI